MCHSVTRLTLCPFFLSSHKCLCVIRSYFTWCHWFEDEGLVMDLETIDVAMSIMHCLFVVLPWAPKEHVTHCHWHHITLPLSLNHCTKYGLGCFRRGSLSFVQSSMLSKL